MTIFTVKLFLNVKLINLNKIVRKSSSSHFKKTHPYIILPTLLFTGFPTPREANKIHSPPLKKGHPNYVYDYKGSFVLKMSMNAQT